MFIRSSDLEAIPGLVHGYFTRQGGVSTGIYEGLNIGLGSSDDRANVLENRRRVAAALGLEAEALSLPYQVHSPDAVVVTESWGPVAGPRVDAVVTRTPGVAIGVSSADCGPILFADPEAKVIAAAHSGWKGAIGGVIETTVATMVGEGARADRIVAVLGPCISQAAYEVGPEFVDRFLGEDSRNSRFFAPSDKPGHAMFDMPGYIVARLEAAGVGRAASLGLCTYGDEARFYSYRRTTHRKEPDYGRLVSAIALTD